MLHREGTVSRCQQLSKTVRTGRIGPAVAALYPLLRQASASRMPQATDTLRLSTAPVPGIMTDSSARAAIGFDTPSPSLPSTSTSVPPRNVYGKTTSVKKPADVDVVFVAFVASARAASAHLSSATTPLS